MRFRSRCLFGSLALTAASAAATPASDAANSQDGSIASMAYRRRLTVSHRGAGQQACPVSFDAATVGATTELDQGEFAKRFSRELNRFAQVEDNLCLVGGAGPGHGGMYEIQAASLEPAPIGAHQVIHCLTGAGEGKHVVSQTLAGPFREHATSSSGSHPSLPFRNGTAVDEKVANSPTAHQYCSRLADRLELAKSIISEMAAAGTHGHSTAEDDSLLPVYSASMSSEFELRAAGGQCAMSFFGISHDQAVMGPDQVNQARAEFQDRLIMNPQGMCFGIVPGEAGPEAGAKVHAKVVKNAANKPVLQCSDDSHVRATYLLPFAHTAGQALHTFPSPLADGQPAAAKSSTGTPAKGHKAGSKSGGPSPTVAKVPPVGAKKKRLWMLMQQAPIVKEPVGSSTVRRRSKKPTSPTAGTRVTGDAANPDSAAQVGAGVAAGDATQTEASSPDVGGAPAVGTPIDVTSTAGSAPAPPEATSAYGVPAGDSPPTSEVVPRYTDEFNPDSPSHVHEKVALKYCAHLLRMRSVFEAIVNGIVASQQSR